MANTRRTTTIRKSKGNDIQKASRKHICKSSPIINSLIFKEPNAYKLGNSPTEKWAKDIYSQFSETQPMLLKEIQMKTTLRL